MDAEIDVQFAPLIQASLEAPFSYSIEWRADGVRSKFSCQVFGQKSAEVAPVVDYDMSAAYRRLLSAEW